MIFCFYCLFVCLFFALSFLFFSCSTRPSIQGSTKSLGNEFIKQEVSQWLNSVLGEASHTLASLLCKCSPPLFGGLFLSQWGLVSSAYCNHLSLFLCVCLGSDVRLGNPAPHSFQFPKPSICMPDIFFWSAGDSVEISLSCWNDMAAMFGSLWISLTLMMFYLCLVIWAPVNSLGPLEPLR